MVGSAEGPAILDHVLHRPARVTAVLAALTALCVVIAVTRLQVTGDIARAIRGTSPAFAAYEQLEARFGSPSQDEGFLVEAADFGTADSFAALEDLVVGLQLTDGVRGVLSPFAVPDPDGAAPGFLSRPDIGALPPDERLSALRTASPLGPYLVSEDRRAVLLTVLPDLSMPPGARHEALAAELALADAGLRIRPVGIAAMQREIGAGLVRDQAMITPASTLLCAIVALLIFRSWRAAVLCTVPSIAALAWTFGLMALLGLPLDPLMAIVPPIVLVLGVAGCVHVHHAVQRHAGVPVATALARGLHETMPAVILAALTTALAFLCLRAVGSPTLANVAYAGALGVGMTVLAVYLVLPALTLAMLGRGALTAAPALMFAQVTAAATRVLRAPRLVSVLALGLLALLLVAQSRTVIGSRLADHLPRDSALHRTIADMAGALPGSDLAYVLLPAADTEPGVSAADSAMLTRASRALYDDGGLIVPDGAGPAGGQPLLRRFEAANGADFALPLAGPLGRSGAEILAAAEDTRTALTAEGLPEARIAGYSLMASTELPQVVRDLRLSFYIAIALLPLLGGWLLGSLRVAVLALVPNLLPILGVEAWLMLTDRPLTIVGAMAFTIAFGIAVDDTVHLLNRLRLACRGGRPLDRSSMTAALETSVAPIVGTSLVLFAGFGTTIFSTLPTVSIFGQLTAAVLVIALVTDLFLFPSLLIWGARGVRLQ
ncbi:efflux RND transporter permease subunit [Roseisalinus antarcticus]|uniref:MMPL family protein n=1 Tax=Roseisalinus antarcticus TaxID=254357 RepID=A0A1Y5TCP1_9RHOB|nr:MMPL family transporter [Roseisalinus antarcticus]SLN60975.1 MMPL family protein [Roseisalinus antarcticus]